jgi:hypothetical protein
MISAFAEFDASPRTSSAVPLAYSPPDAGLRATTTSAGYEAALRLGALDKRIVQLASDFYDDHGRPLHSPSVAGFKALMRHILELPQPSLGAESSGSIVATWEGAGGCLSLRFLDKSHLHFAISRNGEAGRRERAWGEGHVETFFAEHPEAKTIVAG